MVESSEIKAEVGERFTLNDGTKIPKVGLGTFLLSDNPKEIVKAAILKHGYRHIDTAMIYNNEEAVGEAINECIAAGVPRSEIFVTTKLWHTEKNDVEKALRDSLARLKLDYVDLYLVHWMRPHVDWESENWNILSPPTHVVWANMEKMVGLGLTKSIGVSNCTIPMMADLICSANIKPSVNQIEIHPYFTQKDVKRYHDKWGVYLEAYASIGSGHWSLCKEEYKNKNALTSEVVAEIAQSKSRSAAQIILRWHVQRGTIPLVKTTKEARLTENISLFDFELTDEEMTKIDNMNIDMRLYDPVFIKDFDWNNMPFYN